MQYIWFNTVNTIDLKVLIYNEIYTELHVAYLKWGKKGDLTKYYNTDFSFILLEEKRNN